MPVLPFTAGHGHGLDLPDNATVFKRIEGYDDYHDSRNTIGTGLIAAGVLIAMLVLACGVCAFCRYNRSRRRRQARQIKLRRRQAHRPNPAYSASTNDPTSSENFSLPPYSPGPPTYPGTAHTNHHNHDYSYDHSACNNNAATEFS
jgi:Tfp pilus assembly protein PilV